MKKITLLTTLLFVLTLVACGKKEAEKKDVLSIPECATPECRLPIAYVNIDSILSNYNVAKDANELLIKKQEDARLSINEKAQKFQNEVAEFNRKLENNAFLSRERAEQEAQRLQKKESDLQVLGQKLEQEFMDETQKINAQLREDINNAIKSFNSDGRYHLILTTGAMQENVLFSVEGYDISNDILELLNSTEK